MDPDHCLKENSYRDLEEEEEESSESELELRSRRRDFFFLDTTLCIHKENSSLTSISKRTALIFIYSFCVRYSTLLHLPPPSDSTVSEDAGIESRTFANLALKARRSSHSARSHPHRFLL